jgi:pimeloyl-ACP methyl ester carboxylesterase
MTCGALGDTITEVDLSAGAILYEDSGGKGPVVVLCHGLLMTASLWDAVVAELGPGFRCVRPTLPLGAHRQPMRPEADLSLRGQVRLLAEFLERLELEEVTLVFNDWCGAQLLVAEGWDRLPMTFGLMSKRPIPDALVDQWLEPALTHAAIRRDLRKYAGDTRQGRRQLVKANPRLADFGKLVLVAWAAEDKVVPAAAGRRLAAAFPDSRFIEIPDSQTLIPIDQPRALVGAIATFISNT